MNIYAQVFGLAEHEVYPGVASRAHSLMSRVGAYRSNDDGDTGFPFEPWIVCIEANYTQVPCMLQGSTPRCLGRSASDRASVFLRGT